MHLNQAFKTDSEYFRRPYWATGLFIDRAGNEWLFDTEENDFVQGGPHLLSIGEATVEDWVGFKSLDEDTAAASEAQQTTEVPYGLEYQ